MFSSSGKYNYQMTYYKKTLNDWVMQLHEKLTKIYKVDFVHIEPGTYIYEIYITILSNIFIHLENNKNDIIDYVNKKINTKKYLAIIHTSWIENYTYWFNHMPEKNNDIYKYDVYDTQQIEYENNNDYKLCTKSDLLKNDIKKLYNNIYTLIFDEIVHITLTSGINNININ